MVVITQFNNSLPYGILFIGQSMSIKYQITSIENIAFHKVVTSLGISAIYKNSGI